MHRQMKMLTVVVLSARGDVVEMKASTLNTIQRRVFGKIALNTVFIHKSDNNTAAVVACGVNGLLRNERFEQLLDAECQRRGYTPSEFMTCDLGGSIMLYIQSIDGVHSMTLARFQAMMVASNMSLPWLEKATRARMATLVESPQRVVQ